jgi:acetolactate synthase-1/2/3 large subunit
MKTVAEVLARRLLEAGVRTLFGMPGGGSNLDVLEAAERAGLPFVLSHTETAGALMACAQAEVTGKPGACVATLGPGVASITNGVAHARLDRTPLVVLADGPASTSREMFAHQRIDHGALLGPVVKASVTLDATDADRLVCTALARALAPPAGPVHLDCPSDVASMPAGSRADVETEPDSPPPTRMALPDALLRRARRPVFLAGLGIRCSPDAQHLRSICERRGAPVLVTYKAKGVVPDDHPCFAGVFTHAAIEESFVRSADLIIGVGLDPVELLPRPWTFDAPVAAVGAWPLTGRHVPVAGQATGEIAVLLDALDARLAGATDWEPDEIRAQADRHRAAVRVETAGFAPYAAVEAAARAAGPDARATVDAGAHMFPVTALWPVREPRQLLISNGLSTMGFAVPAAIGAALVEPGRRVIALTGDGGLLICLGELATIARLRLPITVVVFSDRSLSLIRIKQERLGHPTGATAIGDLDWVSLARGFGLPGRRAAGAHELERGLQDAAAGGGPALVAADIDSAAYPETLRAVRG